MRYTGGSLQRRCRHAGRGGDRVIKKQCTNCADGFDPDNKGYGRVLKVKVAYPPTVKKRARRMWLCTACRALYKEEGSEVKQVR